jgi:hypothetical protein
MPVTSLQTNRPAPTSGVATINFGPFPGSSSAVLMLPGWSDMGIPAQPINAWAIPFGTADHTADEHVADPPRFSAAVDGLGNIVISGFPSGRDLPVPPGTPFGNSSSQMPIGNQQPMPYGAWSVGWAYSL